MKQWTDAIDKLRFAKTELCRSNSEHARHTADLQVMKNNLSKATMALTSARRSLDAAAQSYVEMQRLEHPTSVAGTRECLTKVRNTPALQPSAFHPSHEIR